MPSSASLICVDPARVAEFWPHVRNKIRIAIEATGLSRFEDTERDVLNGAQLLWLAWNGTDVEAAATTQLSANVCVIVACAGHYRERWLHLLDQIEAYAKAEGCRAMRIYGRKGWERALTGYRVEHVVLEKPL